MFETGVMLGVVVSVGVMVVIVVGVGVNAGVEVYMLVDLPQAETTKETPINRANNKPNQRHVDLVTVILP